MVRMTIAVRPPVVARCGPSTENGSSKMPLASASNAWSCGVRTAPLMTGNCSPAGWYPLVSSHCTQGANGAGLRGFHDERREFFRSTQEKGNAEDGREFCRARRRHEGMDGPADRQARPPAVLRRYPLSPG